MDSFWSKLLLLGIVAAIGMFFIANVYQPQKTAQEAMAESTQQSVNAVKSGVDESAPSIVDGENAISTVFSYCKDGNTVAITIEKIGGNTYTYTNSTTSTSYSGGALSNATITATVDVNKKYQKTVNKSGVQIASIEFVEQN